MSHNVFLSYSRQNRVFVDRILVSLRDARFEVWRDTDALRPGTPNWERSVRDAIKLSEVVILVASPDALASEYVQGELGLAKAYNRPIYPVWADGENWIECVPMDMLKYQYCDCRNGNYQDGVTQLVTTLNQALNRPDDFITLGLPTHETIIVGLAQFQSGFELANHVYLNYLQNWYEPFTYGREWVLGNVRTKQVAIPWEWVGKTYDLDIVSALNETELDDFQHRISLSDVGIVGGSYWAVWDARRLESTVIFLKRAQTKNTLLSADGISELSLLIRQGTLEVRELDEIAVSSYSHKIVIANLSGNEHWDAIVEL